MSNYLVTIDRFNGDATVLHRLPFSLYPDNSPVLNMAEVMPGADIRGSHILTGMLVKYTTYQEFVAAMMFAYGLNNGRRSPVLEHLYIPYMPAARQDKARSPRMVNNEATGDVLHSLEFTVNLIKMAGFKTVTVMDPHSTQTEHFVTSAGLQFRDTTQWVPKLFARAIHTKYDGVIAPDKGAADRALAFAKELDVPLLLGGKTRNPETNALTGFHVNGIHRGDHYLVVDDICDGGGTFMGLYDGGIAPHASADLFVTHGLFTKGAAGRLQTRYDDVYMTDSLGFHADGAEELPMLDECMQFGNATYTNILEGKR